MPTTHSKSAKPTKPSSPTKKTSTGKFNTISPKNRKLKFELHAVGFPPTGVEAYCYVKVSNTSSKDEGYTYNFRRMVDTEEEEFTVPYLRNAGFMAYFYQRDNSFEGQRLNGESEDYPRYWMIRVIPGDVTSSTATRAEGMNILDTFFKDTDYHKYPPRYIRHVDITETPPLPMNRYMLDSDIIGLMREIFDENLLNPTFATEWPDYANILFSGPRTPVQAVERFGFQRPPNMNPNNGGNGAYAPDFVPEGGIPLVQAEPIVQADAAEPVEENSEESKQDESAESPREVETNGRRNKRNRNN